MRAFLSFCFVLSLLQPVFSTVGPCSDLQKYPIGLGNPSGTISYNTVDVFGTQTVVAGYCGSTDICGSDAPRPIIESFNNAAYPVVFTWSKYAPKYSSYTNDKVESIKFKPDGSKLAAVLNIDGEKMHILIIQASDGTLVQSFMSNTVYSGSGGGGGGTSQIKHYGLLFESSDHVVMAFLNDDQMGMLRVPLLVGAATSTTSVFQIYTSLTDNHQSGRLYSITYDHPTTPTGYIVSGLIKLADNQDQGTYFFHVQPAGSRSWFISPNYNTNRIDQMTVNTYGGFNYLWGCGKETQSGSSTDALFTKIRVSGTTPPAQAEFMALNQNSASVCIAIQGLTDVNALALVTDSNSGIISVYLAKIKIDTPKSVVAYTGLASQFAYSGTKVLTAIFSGGYVYFAGQLRQYTDSTYGTILSVDAAYVMKMTTTESSTFSGSSCSSYTLNYGSSNDQSASSVVVSIKVSNSDIQQSGSETFTKVTPYSLTNLGTTNMQRLKCNPDSSALTFVDQNWDLSLLTGTGTAYTFPDFNPNLVCTGVIWTYSAEYNPTQGAITFATPSSRTFDWSTATIPFTYTVTVYGSFPNAYKFIYRTYILTITDACDTATITGPAADSLTYAISDPVAATKTLGTFTLSVPVCEISYSFLFSNLTTISGTNPLFSFTGNTTVQAGTSTNNLLVGTYTIKVVAKVVKNIFATASQTFNVVIQDQCYTATAVQQTAHVFSYTIADSSINVAMTPFTITQPSGVTCFTYNLYKADQLTVETTGPSYIKYAPSTNGIKIGPTVGGEIGLAPSVTYNWYIKATNVATGTIFCWQSLTVTIYHECTTATISANPAGDTFAYTILQPTQSNTITSLTPAGFPSKISCISYSLYESDQTTSASLTSFLSYDNKLTITSGPTVSNQIDPNPFLTYNWYIKGQRIITPYLPVFAPVTLTVYHECYKVSLTTPTLNTFVYTGLDKQQVNTMTSFTLSPVTGSLSCFTFNLKDAFGILYSKLYMKLAYPTLTIGKSISGQMTSKTETVTVNVEGTQKLDATVYLAPVQFTFYHECYNFPLATPMSTSKDYIVTQPTLTFTVPSFTTNSACVVNYDLYYSDGITKVIVDPIFSFDPKTFVFTVQKQTDASRVGNHNFILAAWVDMGINTASTTITVSITCQVLGITPDQRDVEAPGSISMELVEYVIGQGTMILPFHEFIPQINCGTDIDYTFQLVDTFPYPNFITTNTSVEDAGGTLNINVKSRKKIFQTQWELMIIAHTEATMPPTSAKLISALMIPLQLIIPNTGPPEFKTSLKDVIMKIGDIIPYRMPAIYDPDDDDTPFIESIEWGDAKTFVSGKFPNFLFEPNNNETQLGRYDIKISLMDDNPAPQTSMFLFILIVEPLPPAKFVAGNNQTKTGPFKSNFTIPSKRLQAKIKSINKQGIVTVVFNNALMIPANITSIDQQVLDIKVKPGRDSDPQYLGISSWSVQSFNKMQMQIELIFENPLRISISSSSVDGLKITFLMSEFFVEASSGETLPRLTEISKDIITRQLPRDSATARLMSASGPTTSTINSMMYGNMAVNIFMSASLQMLWGLVNVMQLIVNMPLLNIPFPQNAAVFYSFINNIANFDIIPTDKIQAALFSFNEAKKNRGDNFETMGYESDNILENLGSMMLYLTGFVLVAIIAVIMKFLKDRVRLINMAYTFLANLLFFNFILRMFQEGYMEFALTSIMNVTHLQWDNTSDSLSSVFAIFILTVIISLPFAVWLLLWIKQKSLNSDNSQRTFGATYTELRVDNRPALLYNVIQMLRRMIFATTAALLDDYSGCQVMIIIFHSLFVIIYIQHVQPFELPFMNKLEVFNEVCIIIAAYHLILFTEFVDDPQLQYNGGWSIIAFTLFNILCNMFIMLKASLQKLKMTWRKLKLKWENWNKKKLQKEVETTSGHQNIVTDNENLKNAIKIKAKKKLNNNKNKNKAIAAQSVSPGNGGQRQQHQLKVSKNPLDLMKKNYNRRLNLYSEEFQGIQRQDTQQQQNTNQNLLPEMEDDKVVQIDGQVMSPTTSYYQSHHSPLSAYLNARVVNSNASLNEDNGPIQHQQAEISNFLKLFGIQQESNFQENSRTRGNSEMVKNNKREQSIWEEDEEDEEEYLDFNLNDNRPVKRLQTSLFGQQMKTPMQRKLSHM